MPGPEAGGCHHVPITQFTMTYTGNRMRSPSRLAVLAAISLASARVEADPIVLESYGGARPPDADRLLAPVHAELARAGFPTPPEVARRVGERVSRSGRPLAADAWTASMQAIDVGYQKGAVAEANKLGIPVIGVVDTNHSPENVAYVIPGNDDSSRAIRLYVRGVADAVLEGRQDSLKEIARGGDEFVEVEETEGA